MRYKEPGGPGNVIQRVKKVEKHQKKTGIVFDYDPDDKPGPVTGVDLDFRVREKKNRIDYTAIVKWDPLVFGICAADVRYYIIQFERCTSAGAGIEETRQRELVIIEDQDDLTPEMLRAVFEKVPNPKKWYYHARVRVVDQDFRKGTWSDWTSPAIPHRVGDPSPPFPTGIVMSFSKQANREEPRWKIKVSCNEIAFWDVPPTTDRGKVETSLSADITAGADSFNVNDAANLPTPVSTKASDRVFLTIRPNTDNREIISYSGKSTGTLTGVKRGLDGTAKRAHLSGAKVLLSAEDAQEAQNDLKTYQCRIRRCNVDANGVFVSWVTDEDGKFIQRRDSNRWDSEDEDKDGIVKFRFANVRKKHWWRASVRTRDRFNRWGEFSEWTAPGSPSDTIGPPNIPAPLVMDVDPRRITLIWDAPSDPDDIDADLDLRELHPDIAYFQIQVSDRADFNKGLSGFWRSDRYHKTQTKSFKKKKTERGPFHARVRPVDGSGKKGNWLSTNRQRKTPGKARNVQTYGRTRAVVVKFDPPNTWSDLTTDEFTLDEVAHYEIDLFKNGVLYEQDVQVKSLRKSFPVPKADSNGTWSAKVRVIGREGTYTTEDNAVGAAVPESAGADSFAELAGSIGSNQIGMVIDYTKLTGSLGGTRYGSYSTLISGSGETARRYIQYPPSPQKAGDALFNTSDGRMYKSDGATFWAMVEGSELTVGTVVADVVRTGVLESYTVNAFYINGGIITGTLFRTRTTGMRAEMGGSSYPDRIAIFNSNSLVGSIQGEYLGTVWDDGALVSKSNLMIQATGAGNAIKLDAGAESIFLNSPLKAGGTFFMGGHHIRMNSGIIYNCNYIELNESAGGDTPGSAKLMLFKEAGAKRLIIKYPDGTRFRVDQTVI